jgi:hypothetical protein
MGGLFGGLLGTFEHVGLGFQYIARACATLLIGSSARNWNLDTRPREHPEFYVQRANREALGAFCCYVVLMAIGAAVRRHNFPQESPIWLAMAAVFAILPLGGLFVAITALRDRLEKRNAPPNEW